MNCLKCSDSKVEIIKIPYTVETDGKEVTIRTKAYVCLDCMVDLVDTEIMDEFRKKVLFEREGEMK